MRVALVASTLALLPLVLLALTTAAAPLHFTDVDVAASSATSAAGFLNSYLSSAVAEVRHFFFTPRLLQTSPDQPPFWTIEAAKHWYQWRRINFFDVTDYHGTDAFAPHVDSLDALAQQQVSPVFPSKTAYADKLHSVFANISEAGPRENLAKFTSFRTRYYRSDDGKKSQAWLKSRVEQITADCEACKVTEHPHPWGQNSIILTISGADKKAQAHAAAKGERYITVLGAHQDSTNLIPLFAAPGADDDGSGTVTLLETLRALLSQGWRPKTDVEFHWYSAEEGGLLGSQEVVKTYVANGRAALVKGMLQQDMTAFVKAGTEPKVGIVADFVNPDLTAFLRDVIVKEYLEIPPVETKLGYAGSDHASWTKAGVASAFLIEAAFEDCNLKRIHTTQDTFDHPEFSFEHLLQFVRLSASTAVELGGWA